MIAVALNFAGLGAYWSAVYFQKDEAPVRVVRIMKYSELGPPPSITETKAVTPSIAVSTAVKPGIGIPVPVPDALVDPEQTFASQTELSQVVGQMMGEGQGNGQTKIVAEESDFDLQIEDDGPPPDSCRLKKRRR